MAIKRFCDIDGCGKEVTDYPLSGFVTLAGVDFKVTIELATENPQDLCAHCFWTVANGLDKPPSATAVVNFNAARAAMEAKQ